MRDLFAIAISSCLNSSQKTGPESEIASTRAVIATHGDWILVAASKGFDRTHRTRPTCLRAWIFFKILLGQSSSEILDPGIGISFFLILNFRIRRWYMRSNECPSGSFMHFYNFSWQLKYDIILSSEWWTEPHFFDYSNGDGGKMRVIWWLIIIIFYKWKHRETGRKFAGWNSRSMRAEGMACDLAKLH